MNRVFAAACAAACLTFSAAHADGAFVLDEASLDKVTAAGFVSFNVRYTKTVEIDRIVENNVKTKTVDIDVNGRIIRFDRPAPPPRPGS